MGLKDCHFPKHFSGTIIGKSQSLCPKKYFLVSILSNFSFRFVCLVFTHNVRASAVVSIEVRLFFISFLLIWFFFANSQ